MLVTHQFSNLTENAPTGNRTSAASHITNKLVALIYVKERPKSFFLYHTIFKNMLNPYKRSFYTLCNFFRNKNAGNNKTGIFN